MSAIPQESYAEFSRIIHNQGGPRRLPLNGTIELTNRCPLACSHCYNNLPMNDVGARLREMSRDEYRHLFDELADLGCLWLCFSGGEIFARRDFPDIYLDARKKGFLITLFTNGILINERIADFLAAHPPFTIEITLYGATPETYETLTRIPGSYEKCMRAIDLLVERNLPLKLKTVAVSTNHHQIEAMRQIAADRGLEFKFDAMINPRIDCSSSPLAVRLTPSEVVSLDLDDATHVAEWRRLVAEQAPRPYVPGEERKLFECGGGHNTFAVDPYGELSICVLSHKDTYNVRDGSFRDGWENYIGAVRSRNITRPTKCTGCGLKSLCGMCTANGELENGDAESPVDFLCEVAHLRAETLDIPVRPHGQCEYCEGGERHPRIREAAQKLKKNEAERIAAIADVPPQAAAASCGSGGCGSCAVAP